MIRKIILFLALAWSLPGAIVTISDTVYNADGTKANGTVTISWNEFTSADGVTIAANHVDVPMRAGVFNVNLEPNAGALPAMTSYTARYAMTTKTTRIETWYVPASATPLKIGDIRVSTLLVPIPVFQPSQVARGGAITGDVLTWNGSWGPAAPTGGGGGGITHINGQTGATQTIDNADGLITITSSSNNHRITFAGVSRLPTTGEKAALAGTSGTPGSGNKYVTDADSRNTNARTPSAHAVTHLSNGTDPISAASDTVRGTVTMSTAASSKAVADDDSRNTNSRTPTAHEATHLSNGSDPIAAASTSIRGTVTTTTSSSQVASTDDSRLSDSRPPNGSAAGDLVGSYPNPMLGTSGVTAAQYGSVTQVPQVTFDAKGRATAVANITITGVTPAAHAASHKNGGSDEVATATPGANVIPKAGSGGFLAAGFIPDLSTTYALASHALLSTTHSDTTAASVQRGDVITGQGASPAWVRLAKGTQYTVLQAGANEPAYDAVHLDQSAAVTGILPNANTTATNANTASAIVRRDASGNFSAGIITASLTGLASLNELPLTFSTGLTRSTNTITIDSSIVATLTGSQTLTNKTLTSPVINTPTGIVKGDVGLGSVDNTSDATKNAATATLTSKKLADSYTAGSGGVTLNLLIGKDATDPTQAVITSSGGCGFGLALATASSGNAFNVQWGGIGTAVADNTVTAGHILIGGTSTPGRVRDSGQTSRSGIDAQTCVVGFAQSGATVGNTLTVLLTMPGDYGTLVSASDFASQSPNVVLAGPTSGGAATPTFRAMVPADLPLVPLANGGTNCAAPFVPNAQTSTYQVVAGDFTCFKTISVASGTFTITLVPSGSQPATGLWINVINYGSGVVTVARSGQNINGGTSSLTLSAGSATAPTSTYIFSDGTNYFANVAGGSSGLADPGSNGFLDRTALNTASARTLTGTTNQVSITNGSGGGNPVFSLPQNYDTAATPQLGRLGLNQAADANAPLAITNNGAANTSGNGELLQASTAATSGNQYYAPPIIQCGNGWKTAATAGSQANCFKIEEVPIQSGTNPMATLLLSTNTNGGAWTKLFYFGQESNLLSIWPGSVTVDTPGNSNSNFGFQCSGTSCGINGTSTSGLYIGGQGVFFVRSGATAGLATIDGVNGLLTKLGNVATAGYGVPTIRASSPAQNSNGTSGTPATATATVGPTNLQCGGAVCPVGLYKVHTYFRCSTTGAGVWDVSIGWSDPTAARTATNGTNGTPTDISCATSVFGTSTTLIEADGATNITYTFTPTGRTTDVLTYRVELERMQ